MSKLKTEGTGGFLLTPAEQTTSLGLGSGVQMHLQGCPLCRLHQWYIQNWLAGGCLVSAILTPGSSNTQTCCLCGRLFLGKVGYKGRKGWLPRNCWPLTLSRHLGGPRGVHLSLRAGLGSSLQKEEYRQYPPLPNLLVTHSIGTGTVRLEGPWGRRSWARDQKELPREGPVAGFCAQSRKKEGCFGHKRPGETKTGVSLPL